MRRHTRCTFLMVTLLTACGLAAAGLPPEEQILITSRFITTPVVDADRPRPRFLSKATEQFSPEQDVLSAPRVTTLGGNTAVLRMCNDETGEGVVVEVTPTVVGKQIRLKGNAWVLKASGTAIGVKEGDSIEWQQGLHVDFTIHVSSSQGFVAITSLPHQDDRQAKQLEIQLSAVLAGPQGNLKE